MHASKRKDLIAGLSMVVLGALIIWVLIPNGVVEPRKVKYAALSPSYYPRIVAYALLALGLGVVWRSFVARAIPAEAENRHPHAGLRITAFLGILAGLALGLQWLGFIVACSIAALLGMWLAGEKRLWVSVPIALLLPLLLYFFFLKVARVPIPLGVLEPWLAGV